jgi:hypothetical protein
LPHTPLPFNFKSLLRSATPPSRSPFIPLYVTAQRQQRWQGQQPGGKGE